MENLVPPEFDWLLHGLLACLALGLTLSVVIGVMLLLRPTWVFGINERWSRWIETNGQFEALDRPRSIERLFYRYHRITGGLITLGSAFVLWEWVFAYRPDGVFAMLGSRWQQPELSWIISAGEWAVVLLHLAILAIGVVIAIRPSLLKQIESESNRWHDADVSGVMDQIFSPIEQVLKRHPRVAGGVLLLAASWCLLGLVPVVVRLLT